MWLIIKVAMFDIDVLRTSYIYHGYSGFFDQIDLHLAYR